MMNPLWPSAARRRSCPDRQSCSIIARRHLRCAFVVCWWLAIVSGAGADVLITTNGERFVGKIIEETADTVVFESEVGGRLTVHGDLARELKRATPEPEPRPEPAAVFTNALDWIPPESIRDGFDWEQLKSGEWLKGHLKYVQEKKVEFDSDELEEMTLKSKDVRKIYTARRMDVKFEEWEPI
jgi:hypothetical protein